MPRPGIRNMLFGKMRSNPFPLVIAQAEHDRTLGMNVQAVNYFEIGFSVAASTSSLDARLHQMNFGGRIHCGPVDLGSRDITAIA